MTGQPQADTPRTVDEWMDHLTDRLLRDEVTVPVLRHAPTEVAKAAEAEGFRLGELKGTMLATLERHKTRRTCAAEVRALGCLGSPMCSPQGHSHQCPGVIATVLKKGPTP